MFLSTYRGGGTDWGSRVDQIDPLQHPAALAREVVARARDYDAVILRGAMGSDWRYVDQLVAAVVARRGTPVVLGECIWEQTSRRISRAGPPTMVDRAPEGSGRLARTAIRALDTAHTHYCVLSTGEARLFPAGWGIPAERVHPTLFGATASDEGAPGPRPGGRLRRRELAARLPRHGGGRTPGAGTRADRQPAAPHRGGPEPGHGGADAAAVPAGGPRGDGRRRPRAGRRHPERRPGDLPQRDAAREARRGHRHAGGPGPHRARRRRLRRAARTTATPCWRRSTPCSPTRPGCARWARPPGAACCGSSPPSSSSGGCSPSPTSPRSGGSRPGRPPRGPGAVGVAG